MTTPPKDVQVRCPNCEVIYVDWYRPSMNFDLEDFDEDYVRRASTASCPICDCTVDFYSLTATTRWHSGLSISGPSELYELTTRDSEDLSTRYQPARSLRFESREYREPPIRRAIAFGFAEDLAELEKLRITDVKPGHLFQERDFIRRLPAPVHEWWIILGRRGAKGRRVPVYAFHQLAKHPTMRIDGPRVQPIPNTPVFMMEDRFPGYLRAVTE